MRYEDFRIRFAKLGSNYKTKDLDSLAKELIKEKADVSFLYDLIPSHPEYHRIYFQASLGLTDDVDGKMQFIEDNFPLLSDWWHVDQLEQFLDKKLTFDMAYERASRYVDHSNPFARRWAYVMFMPRLVNDKDVFDKLTSLFRDDDEYYVIMAEAWLISYMAVCDTEKTYEYLKSLPLQYNIVGKAIQKICDSYRIDKETKESFKALRALYKPEGGKK